MGIGPAAVAAAPALSRTLLDPDEALRRCAAGALEAIGDTR